MRVRSRGFTLIEVMVALAIVTLGVAAMLASMTSAASNTYFLRDKTFAEWIALNRIAEVRLTEKQFKKGKTEGEAELAGRKWAWKQEILPMQADGMFQIDVSVRPQKEGQKTGSADDDKGSWYTTVSGVLSDAVDRTANDFSEFDMGEGFEAPKKASGPGSPPPPKDDDEDEETEQ